MPEKINKKIIYVDSPMIGILKYLYDNIDSPRSFSDIKKHVEESLKERQHDMFVRRKLIALMDHKWIIRIDKGRNAIYQLNKACDDFEDIINLVKATPEPNSRYYRVRMDLPSVKPSDYEDSVTYHTFPRLEMFFVGKKIKGFEPTYLEKSKKFHASIAKLMNNLSMSRAAQALLNKKAEIVENGRDPDGDKEKREIFWAYAEAQQHGFHLIIKWHPHICYTCRKAGEVGLDLFWRDIFQSSYLFSWGEIPGNDSDRLIDFLKQNYSIDWIEKAEIKKIDDGKTISLSVGKNSISLSLNDEKTKVDLKIDDVRTDEFIANMENGKLNIYETLDELVAQYPFCKTCIEKVNEEAMCLI